MTKHELASEISSYCPSVPQNKIIAVLEGLASVVRTNAASGVETALPGIGKIDVKARPARMGRNPRTGEAVAIPAAKRAVFKPSKALRDALGQ